MNDNSPLQVWINHVFDHPVTDPAWYWSPDAAATRDSGEDWPELPNDVTMHIAATFERGGELLSPFSDEQVNQGFWYLFDSGNSPDFMATLLNDEIPAATRARALRSFVPLFEQVMAARCTPNLSHLDEQPANPLNSACYMWFDNLLDRFSPEKLMRSQLGVEFLIVLSRVLAIPHDACRESALHGIGHWIACYPQLADIVNEFLSTTPDLRPQLIEYANGARVGDLRVLTGG